MESNVFLQFGLLLAITAAVATVMRALHQPLIIGYIITGLLIGPQLLGVFKVDSTFDTFSHFGIALLLFIIGLGLNPKVIREVGRPALIVGLSQVFFTSLLGFWLARAMNFSTTEAFFIGTSLMLSSTVIIMKILSDKRETTQLYAKIITGLLLVQDIVATLLLISLGSSGRSGIALVATFGIGATMLIAVIVFGLFVMSKFENFIASNQEYLFIFSIAWGFGIASLFALTGLSIEVGALFAGIALASQSYAQEISSRLRPLRDFFIILFFVVLGAQIELSQLTGVIGPAVILSLFVLLGNPFVVLTILGLMGYTKKTSFKASMTVGQISEFSLIYILLAVSLGRIDPRIGGMVTLVGLITIAISTYMMMFDEKIFSWVQRYLSFFERRYVKREKHVLHESDIILFGYKRGGREFVHSFEKLKHQFLVVDYDPEVITELRKNKQSFAYGDANDVEFLDEIALDKAKLIVSAVRDPKTNLFITTQARAKNPNAVIIVHAEQPEEAMELYDHEATYVMMPRYISAERIGHMIDRAGLHKSGFRDARAHHLKYIESHLDS